MTAARWGCEKAQPLWEHRRASLCTQGAGGKVSRRGHWSRVLSRVRPGRGQELGVLLDTQEVQGSGLSDLRQLL